MIIKLPLLAEKRRRVYSENKFARPEKALNLQIDLNQIKRNRQPNLLLSNRSGYAKPKTSRNYGPGTKLATQMQYQLKKYEYLKEKQRLNEQSSSDQQRHLMTELKRVSEAELADSNLFRFKTNGHDEEQLVGQKAVGTFYSRHKFLDKIQERQKFHNNNQVKPITIILRLLQKWQIPPKKLEIIKQKGQQAFLDLPNCGLGQKNNAMLLGDILQKIQGFTAIDLSSNDIHLDIIQKIIPCLQHMTYINLCQNKIGKVGCIMLSNLLKQSSKLQHLQIQSNQLSDPCCCLLLDGLSRYKKLKILNLSNNNLGDMFVSKLSEVWHDQSLKELYLHWNQITHKGAVVLFDLFTNDTQLKVLDLSWNSFKDSGERIKQSIRRFVEINHSIVHLDLSYCGLNLQCCVIMQKALMVNNTIVGLHIEGNYGYVDTLGRLVIEDTEEKTVEYPIPLSQSIIRRIRGVHKCLNKNIYKKQIKFDICWICDQYQQYEFRIPKKPEDKGMECFLHLESEGFNGEKLNEEDEYFFLKRMCANKPQKFFFTMSRDDRVVSELHQVLKERLSIGKYMISKVEFHGIVLESINILRKCEKKTAVFSNNYTLNISCKPRIFNKINLKNLILRKKRIERLEKMKYDLKELPQMVIEDPNNLNTTEDQELFQNCIDYDFSHSKILKLVKNNVLNDIREVLVKYYKYIWTAFVNLAEANNQGVFGISEKTIISFAQQVRYITKKFPTSKLVVKYKNAASEGTKSKLMRRSQFVECLIRIAEEKWCSGPNQLLRKKSIKQKLQSQRSISPSSPRRQEEDEIRSRNSSVSIFKTERKFLVVNNLAEGIQKTLRALINYHHKYDPSVWRNSKFLVPDIKLLFESNNYGQIAQSIFEIYAKRKKFLYFTDLVKMLEKIGIQITQIIHSAFLYCRKLESEDLKQAPIQFNDFKEVMARTAESINLAPFGCQKITIFEEESHRAQTPLVFKLESLMIKLYWAHHHLLRKQINNKRWERQLNKGIFQQEISVYVDVATEKYSSQQYTDSKVQGAKVRFNDLGEMSGLTLQDLLTMLKQKYDNTVVKRLSEVDEIVEADD